MDGHQIERMLKIRSESADVKASSDFNKSTSQHSLPRGEYLPQNQNLSPKMNLNKNLVKLKPLDVKKITDSDDSFESSAQSLFLIKLILSLLDLEKRLSLTTSDSSQPSSEENTPKARGGEKRLSSFYQRKTVIDTNGKVVQTPTSGRTSIQLEKPDDNCLTPKVARKKGNLYKLTIIQNASKFSMDTKGQPQTATNLRSGDFKTELEMKLAEEVKKEESKSAVLKPVASVQTFEKCKPENTFSIKNLVFGPKIEDKIMKKHLQLILRGLNYSLKLLKPPPMSYIQSRQIMLKELKSKY